MGRAKGNSNAIIMDGFDQAFGRHRGVRLGGIYSVDSVVADQAALDLSRRWDSGDKEGVWNALSDYGDSASRKGIPVQDLLHYMARSAIKDNVQTGETFRRFLSNVGYQSMESLYFDLDPEEQVIHIADSNFGVSPATMLCGKLLGRPERVRRGSWTDAQSACCAVCEQAASASDDSELKRELAQSYYYSHFTTPEEQILFLDEQEEDIVVAYNHRLENNLPLTASAVAAMEKVAQQSALVTALHAHYVGNKEVNAIDTASNYSKDAFRKLAGSFASSEIDKKVNTLPEYGDRHTLMPTQFYYKNLLKRDDFEQLFTDWLSQERIDRRILHSRALESVRLTAFKSEAYADWMKVVIEAAQQSPSSR